MLRCKRAYQGHRVPVFPIEIEYQDTGETVVCYSVHDVMSGRPFVVVKTSGTGSAMSEERRLS